MDQGDAELFSLLATDLDSHFRRLVEIYQQRLYHLTIQDNQPITTEIVDFFPLFESHAVCVLTVSGPPGSHIGPWVFHFTIEKSAVRIGTLPRS